MAKSEDERKPQKGQKKHWFKRLLDRVAKANEQSGGQSCTS
jgi:hypothetical protein